jgi:NADH dehydrogenase
VYTPWLHEIAAGTVDTSAVHDADIPLESIRGVRFRRGEVVGIDRVLRHVFLADGSTIPFDMLVCALGSVPHDFDIPGAKAFALQLKRTRDADAIRERMQTLLACAEPGTPRRLFVIGAGTNGVEFAAECASMIAQKKLRSSVRIHVVSTSPTILPILSPFLRRIAQRRLEKLGIVFHCASALTRCDDGMITIQPVIEGIPHGKPLHEACDLCVLALGVRVPDVVASLGYGTNDRGRICVDAMLRVCGESAVFALGDNAVLRDGPSDPQTAQAAIRQANHVAQNIERVILHRALKPYRPRKRSPIVITLGMYDAVASLWGVPMWGYTIAILRRVIDARYFFSTTSFRTMILRMGRGWWTYGKNTRATDQDMDRA